MKNFLKRTKSFSLVIISIVSLLFISCEDEDNPNNRNEFLRTSNPRFQLNLSLITNAKLLQIQGDLVVPPNIAQGSIDGVYVRNIGNRYVAFELAEPNNPVGDCSLPTLEGGLLLVYSCGELTSKYSAIDGSLQEGAGRFPLKSFPVTRRGDILFIN